MRRVSGRVVRVWKRLGKKARARRRMMRVVERAEVGVGVGDGGIFQWMWLMRSTEQYSYVRGCPGLWMGYQKCMSRRP